MDVLFSLRQIEIAFVLGPNIFLMHDDQLVVYGSDSAGGAGSLFCNRESAAGTSTPPHARFLLCLVKVGIKSFAGEQAPRKVGLNALSRH